jgi:hypothetical protein
MRWIRFCRFAAAIARRAMPPVWLALAVFEAHAATSPGPVATCERPASPLPTASTATHRLSLSLYVVGKFWAPETVLAAARDAAAILRSCAIDTARIELCRVAAPQRFHVFSTAVAREMLQAMPVSKPAVLFVDDTRNTPAYDAEAIGRGNGANRPELIDTVWVVHGARDLPQVLAHELVHVLADSGTHSSEPGNLMRADTVPGATHLAPAQCEWLRARGTANGLLQPVRP